MPMRQHQIAGPPVYRQPDEGAVGQCQRGGFMPEGQAGDDGGRRLCAQPLPDPLHRIAVAFGLFPGEMPQHDGTLPVQYTRVQQLRHHPLHPVGMFVHLFEEQDAAIHPRKIRTAQQRTHEAQVAPPQHALRLETRGRAVAAKAHQFQPVRQRIGQCLQRGCIHIGRVLCVEV